LSQPLLPRWARAADYLALLIVVVAIVIAASGGVRVRYLDWRFTMTSPYRLLVWAAAIAILRSVFARQEPIYRHLPAAVVRWVRSTPFRAAGAALVGTRPAIFLVGYLAVAVIGYAPNANMKELKTFESEVMNLPIRWDANWYLGVAMEGYQFNPDSPINYQQNIVFFPGFPLTVRVVALLLGGSLAAYVLAGTIVSLAAFFGALIYVYLLAREDLEEDQARTALWLLAAFPFAYFFGAIYTESLFLLGVAGAFYHLRHREWVRAGIWGLAVGLTKPNGFLLSIPLGILAISPWLPQRIVRADCGAETLVRRSPGARGSSAPPQPLMPAIVAAAMPGVGMLVFSAFIWQLTGTPFRWAEGHIAWGRHYTGLATIVTDRYKYIANAGFTGYISQVPLDFLNAIGVLFVVVSIWPVARRLGLAYAAFILLSLLPALAEGGLLSAGRLSAVLFPAFIWFAGAVPGRHRGGWIASFAANQAFNASLFYTWRQLF
jgi:hypothetical protein